MRISAKSGTFEHIWEWATGGKSGIDPVKLKGEWFIEMVFGILPNLERFNHRKHINIGANGSVHGLNTVGKKPYTWGRFWVAPPNNIDMALEGIPRKKQPYTWMFSMPQKLPEEQGLFQQAWQRHDIACRKGSVYLNSMEGFEREIDGCLIRIGGGEYLLPGVYRVEAWIDSNTIRLTTCPCPDGHGAGGSMSVQPVYTVNLKVDNVDIQQRAFMVFSGLYETVIPSSFMNTKRLVVKVVCSDNNIHTPWRLKNPILLSKVLYPQSLKEVYGATALVYKDLPIVDLVVPLMDGVCLGKFFLWGRFMGYFLMRKRQPITFLEATESWGSVKAFVIHDESVAIKFGKVNQNGRMYPPDILAGKPKLVFESFPELKKDSDK